MLGMYASALRKAFSGLAAVAVLAIIGLTLDQEHASAAPNGTVTVGELTPIALERLAQVTLPGIVVTAARSVQFAGAWAGRHAGQERGRM